MNHCIYILKSLKDNNFYIGKTNNIERRLAEHNSGHISSTKHRHPFVVVKVIECVDEKEAREIEQLYKKGYKREELKREFNTQ